MSSQPLPRRRGPSRSPVEPQPHYLRTSEVAEILFVNGKTISRWAAEGRLPFLKTLGGHRRYPEAEIRALAKTLRHDPTGPAATALLGDGHPRTR
jgi:excisionase family DNA binding protein